MREREGGRGVRVCLHALGARERGGGVRVCLHAVGPRESFDLKMRIAGLVLHRINAACRYTLKGKVLMF